LFYIFSFYLFVSLLTNFLQKRVVTGDYTVSRVLGRISKRNDAADYYYTAVVVGKDLIKYE